MPVYSYDHIHLRTRDPKAMAEYFHRIFDAKILESVQSDGQPRVEHARREVLPTRAGGAVGVSSVLGGHLGRDETATWVDG